MRSAAGAITLALIAAAPGARASPTAPLSPATAGSTSAAPPAQQAASAGRTLRVSGEGRASAAPDLATVTLSAVAVDASLARATRDANDRARRLLDAVAAAGVPAADVQTSRLDVQIERGADRPQDPPRIRGYRVTHALTVKVRDLGRLGALLDRAVAAGANEVEGPAFARADPAPEQARALAAAVRAARAKAEELARAAGVMLGPVLEVREGGGFRPGPVPMLRATAAREDFAVAPGQIAVESQVELVFALE